MIDFKGKNIAILGLGVEGILSVSYLKAKGAKVTVLDEKPTDEITAVLTSLGYTDVVAKGGNSYVDSLSTFDVVVRSPGIRPTIPELMIAREQGVIVTSQTQLFLELCPCLVIGVTGTKGKGTTSSLIYEMLKQSGKDAYLGGNIGLPPFTFLDKLNAQSIVVLEMSSYQLQDVTKSPNIAVLLMITQEHLAPDRKEGKHQNYHADITEYVDAKRNILRFQSPTDCAVLNRDYLATNESDIYTEGNVYYVSREREVAEGAFVRDSALWVRKSEKEKKIIDTKDILLPGGHNVENAAAASMAAILAGVEIATIQHVLKTFKGLEHRLELVAEVEGVSYYDDSFSTTPETAIAAIQAFTKPEILILGGASKGSDFTELGKVIGEAKNIKAIIGIGVEWPAIKKSITVDTSKVEILEGATSMEQVVRLAASIAESGDVVLLSPACSSFDMFPNYKVRGDQFKESVKRLQM